MDVHFCSSNHTGTFPQTIDAGHIVEVTTVPSSSPKKLPVPLIGLERFPTQQEIEGQDARNRRPVRPIDRQRMRPWLMELLDMGNVFGLHWTNRNLGIFQISWKHASRLGWNLETDGDVFERWARHTGIYKEGDPPEPKRWKANFRCALHSLSDVLELTNAVERRGRNACRTYQFLQNSNLSTPKTKTKKPKAEPKVQRALLPLITYERPAVPEPEPIDLVESASSDELLSETESEGSQKDKVIVQRVETKSQDTGEDALLHHDHDYSAGPLKTQKTIYLRQGVGSIVLQREIHNAPDDEIKYNLLSNLDQLASAAVGSETITVQKSPVPGLLEAHASIESMGKISPTKLADIAFDENKEKSEYSLKSLLPRLRARIRESEKVGGSVRKRKGPNIEINFDDVDLSEAKGMKRDKSDTLSPPLSPRTSQKSSSPKKAVKVVAKSKRTRKESDESTSDSTEPLMSSCLLLLEAATRLDNAEKNGGSGSRSSKSNKKGSTPSTGSSVEAKRRNSGRNLRSSKHVEEQSEEDDRPHVDSFEIVIHDGETTEVSQEMVIEEAVCPDEIVQVIYEGDDQEQQIITQVDGMDNSVDMSAYHEILRTTLENIGSELEISTDECSVATTSPKEMAIMRRKKDLEKASPQTVVEFSGQSEQASFPKGLFSGSEIKNENQQEESIVRKRVKGKNKIPTRENVYYVDIDSSGGSICIKQSDDIEVEEKEAESPQATNPLIKNTIGIQQTVIKRELPVLRTSVTDRQSSQNMSSSFLQAQCSGNSPQIFITAAQNPTDQHIIVPMNPGGSGKEETSVVDKNIQSSTGTSQSKAGQSNQVGSFITVGPNGKALLYKSDTFGRTPQKTTVIPVANEVSSASLTSNVKISTLPISSSIKPSVIMSAPVGTVKAPDQTAITTNSGVPIKLFPKVTPQSLSNSSKPTQVAAIASEGRAWILQPRTPTADMQAAKAATIKVISSSSATSVQPLVTSVSSIKTEPENPTQPISSIHLTPSAISVLSKSPSLVTSPSNNFTAALPLKTELEVSETETIVSSDHVIQESCTSVTVPMNTEISVAEVIQMSGDSGAGNKDNNDEVGSCSFVISSVSSFAPESQSNQDLASIDNKGISVEDKIAVAENHHGDICELERTPSSEFASPQLGIVVSQESEKKGSNGQILEISTNPTTGDIIVQTVDHEHQIFIASDQEVQSTLSGEELSRAIEAGQFAKIHSISEVETSVVESTPNVTTSEVCLDMNSKEEIVSHHHCHDSMSMDPSAPLAIGEIPLFATSKGDSDDMGGPDSD